MKPHKPRSVEVTRATVEQIVPLRHRVLRGGLPIEEAHFAGDGHPDHPHWAAWIGGDVVGCATLHCEPYQGEPAWKLRGMAVDDQIRGAGVGRALLDAVEAFVRDETTETLLWCNGRLVAAAFYQRLGWSIVSDLFEIPTAGPHYVMIKRLKSRGDDM